jgi:hypothetical protein
VSKSSTDKFADSQLIRHRAADIDLKHVAGAADPDETKALCLAREGKAIFDRAIKDTHPPAFAKAVAAETAQAGEQRGEGGDNWRRARAHAFLAHRASQEPRLCP